MIWVFKYEHCAYEILKMIAKCRDYCVYRPYGFLKVIDGPMHVLPHIKRSC